MGLFRILFAYLMRNEELINKLADSKPIRKSAQFVAYLLMQSKVHGMSAPNKLDLARRARSITYTFKDKLQEIKDDIKKNIRK